MVAHCSEIGLMLGPFEDGELEPHEMQEVARHLAACADCERLLNDYNLIGRQLREGLANRPPLEGFAQAVEARISRVKRPLATRVVGLLDEVAERMKSPIALGSLAAVAAALTILIATPYTRHYLAHKAPAAGPAVLAAKAAPENPHLVAAASLPNPSQDSHAVISRLETETPSVAMWTDARDNTTVIWLPEGGR
jgi:anti-sigma factor RsiW